MFFSLLEEKATLRQRKRVSLGATKSFMELVISRVLRRKFSLSLICKTTLMIKEMQSSLKLFERFNAYYTGISNKLQDRVASPDTIP